MSHQDFERLALTIPHLHTQNHVHAMYGMIRWLRPIRVLEIGAYFGFSTIWIAKAMRDNGLRPESSLYVVDNFSLHDNGPENITNALRLCGVQDVPHWIIREDSQKMAAFPQIELAVIDGDHSYEGCRADVTKAIAAGAECIMLHDTVNWWGPRQLIEEGIPGFSSIEVDFDSGFGVLLKVPKKPEAIYTKGGAVT